MAYRAGSLSGQASWLRVKAVAIVFWYAILAEVIWAFWHGISNLIARIEVMLSLGKLTFNPGIADANYQNGLSLVAAIGICYGVSKASSLMLDAAKLEWMVEVESHLKVIRENGHAIGGLQRVQYLAEPTDSVRPGWSDTPLDR